jgi:methanol--5-hydroxybenzimidazolylcobamide Co-methyltransferase
MKRVFKELAYTDEKDLVFGRAKHPVTCGYGLTIGGGEVYPEVNYTLPTMNVVGNLAAVRAEFRTMVREILERCAKLQVPGVVLEFEHTFDLTDNPEWGADVTRDTKEIMREYHETRGLKSALRVTVADIRDKNRPPLMRRGAEYDKMLLAFDRCAAAGADILSIESTGGKEIGDDAILQCDILGVLFSVGLLGSRDMEHLWDRIVEIAERTGTVPGGDTDCAHANTAMRLAFMNYIPQVFAAVTRAIGGARSLVAFERGAVGPHKDCGYEGPIVKAITGMPISMEGKSCACAHASHMGNVASAACDLWSNESVQHVRLLGGYAPEVFAEVLAYDCRLMNESLKHGTHRAVRDAMVSGDVALSPEALVIAPAAAIRIAKAIISRDGYYARSLAAALEAVAIIRDAVAHRELTLSDRELTWLDRIEENLRSCPADETAFIAQMMTQYTDKCLPAEYGL